MSGQEPPARNAVRPIEPSAGCSALRAEYCNEARSQILRVHPSCRRLGLGAFARPQPGARARAAQRHADPAASEQAGRVCLRQLLLGQAGEAPPVRVLRGRRQGDNLGDHQPSMHAGILRGTHRHASWNRGAITRSKSRAASPIRCARTQRATSTCRSNGPTRFARSAPSSGNSTRNRVVFYSSGRASLEASYMYALFARMYGNNNLPDSSNMCHESTSVGLPVSIGVPVGTVTLDDFAQDRLPHCSSATTPA